MRPPRTYVETMTNIPPVDPRIAEIIADAEDRVTPRQREIIKQLNKIKRKMK